MKRASCGVLVALAATLLPPAALAGGQRGDSGGGKGRYDLSILYGGAPLSKQETCRLLVEQYGRSHPNARVEMTTVSGDYSAQIKLLAAAGDLADVLRLDDDWTGEQMVNGNVIDLTDRIRKDIRLEDYFLQSWVPFVYKGRIYGLPYDAAVDFIFYNRAHFKTAGLAEPARDPTRWTDGVFLLCARKLTSDRQWGFTYPAATTGSYQAQHALWREGGSLYDRDKTRVTLHEDPSAIRALQAYVDLRNKHKVAPPIEIANQMGAAAMFHSGVASMMLNANWELPNAERARVNAVIDYGVIFMPAGSRGTITRITVDGWGITRNARSRDRAWDLVKWMGGQEAQSFMGAHGAFVPARRKAAFSEAYANDARTSYDEGLLADIAENHSLLAEICLHGAEVAEAWTRATEALWLGKEDALAAARRYNDLMTPILAKEATLRPFAPSYVRSYGELLK